MSGWHGQTCWLRPKFLSGGWHPQGQRPWGWLLSVEMSHPQAALEDATQLTSPRSQGFGTKPTCLTVFHHMGTTVKLRLAVPPGARMSSAAFRCGRRRVSLLWRRPDAELAAAMQHAHKVQHSVVVTVSPGRNRGIPQGLDEPL